MEDFGSYLKRGREARKMTIGELSRATKIKEQSLALLEQGALDELPAAVFVRGFVSAYARAVGVDEQVALERLKARQAPPVEEAALPSEKLLERIPPSQEEERGIEQRRRFGVALVVLLILVVATLTLSLLLGHGSRAHDGISRNETAQRYL